jgi:hypothetical protein
MSASSAACRVCGGVAECACHGHGAGARCGAAVADLNRGFPGMWHQHHQQPEEEEPSVAGGGAAAGLQEFQFFGHDDDHDSVAWLFNDPAPHLHRGPAPAAGADGNGVVAEAAQRRAPLFDGYAHAQYGQLPGHGLMFDVPLGRGGDDDAAVLEAGLGLGGAGAGAGDSNPATTSSATIVSASIIHLCVLNRRES